MEEIAAIDGKTLQRFCAAVGGNTSTFLTELIDCYLEESPRQLQAMELAITQGNVNDLQQAAHILKSSSATLGATTLTQLCRELEVTVSEEITGALKKVLQLEAEYKRVITALQLQLQQQ